MMGSFEQMAIQKKQVEDYNQQHDQYGNEDDGYYDEQDDGQDYTPSQDDLIASLQHNPGMLTDALSKLSTNPQLQQQLGGQNLDMLNNLAAQIELNGGLPGALGGYNPDIIGYNEYLGADALDDEEDDTMYLSMDQVIGSGPQSGYNPLQRQAQKGKGAQPKPVPTNMDDDDDVIDYFLENNASWVICEWFLAGNCKFGDSCQHMHPKSMEPRGGAGKAPTKIGKGGRIEYEGDQDCVICLEPVLANGKRFGILESCAHCFCLDCIRDWRATYDKKVKKTHFRTCPICRENSYLVIPSTKMLGWGPEKDELIEQYTGALEEIPCRHFNKGKGYCPF